MSDLLMALANAASRGLTVKVNKFAVTSTCFLVERNSRGYSEQKHIVISNMVLDKPEAEDILCEQIDEAVNRLA